MSSEKSPAPPIAAAIVARALLGTSIAVLVVGALLNTRGATGGGPEAVSWIGAGWAVVAPLVAVSLRGQGLVAPPPEPGRPASDAAAGARQSILFFAVLESAAVFAGVAAIVSPPAWPLLAGLVPVAVMAVNLPSLA